MGSCSCRNIPPIVKPPDIILNNVECVCCTEIVRVEDFIKMTCDKCTSPNNFIIGHRTCAIILSECQNDFLKKNIAPTWPRCVICRKHNIK